MIEIYNSLTKELRQRFKEISLIATDFDGVLTTNLVVHHSNGEEAVVRSRADSLAIDLLDQVGLYKKADYKLTTHPLDIVILSRESNPVVKSVAEKIRVKCQSSAYHKLEAFREEVKMRKLPPESTLFIGNDLNDIACMKESGLAVAVADSYPQVIAVSDYLTQHKGGNGAFREVVELIMYAKGVHPFP